MKKILILTLMLMAAIATDAQERQSADSIINTKDAFLKGVEAAWDYVKSIGYVDDIKVRYDTTYTTNHFKYIKKRKTATNKKYNSTVEFLSNYDEGEENSEYLHTIVFIWDKKTKKKTMPKELPKMREKHIWLNNSEYYLIEDNYKNTYAIGWQGNPYRPIRGGVGITPFSVVINGNHYSGSY